MDEKPEGPSICPSVVGVSQIDLSKSPSQIHRRLPSVPSGGPGRSPVVPTPRAPRLVNEGPEE